MNTEELIDQLCFQIRKLDKIEELARLGVAGNMPRWQALREILFLADSRPEARREEISAAEEPGLTARQKDGLMGCMSHIKGLVGECPRCGASRAAESMCHSCGYEYQNILSYD